jgi:hypothetical protein
MTHSRLPNVAYGAAHCVAPRLRLTLRQTAAIYQALRAYRQAVRNQNSLEHRRVARALTRILRRLKQTAPLAPCHPPPRHQRFYLDLENPDTDWPLLSRALRPLGSNGFLPGSREARWYAVYGALTRRGCRRLATDASIARAEARARAARRRSRQNDWLRE